MDKPEPFEIGTDADFMRKHPGYAEKVFRSLPPIEPHVVPDNLKHLVTYAEKWGIPDSRLRREYCEAASPEEVAAFKAALQGTHRLYEEWRYLEPEGPRDEKSEKAEKYAQYRFTNMYVAELEYFGGVGLRGFDSWYKEYDPEAYDRRINGC